MTTEKVTTKLSATATLAAIIIGLLCSATIWIAQPVNDFLLGNTGIAGSYLPTIGVAMITFLALIINPFLRWRLPTLALNVRQLALIFGMILVASSATALMQSWPHSLANSNTRIAEDPVLAETHEEMDLPESLYLDPIEYGDETPVSSQLNDELDRGEEIPWTAWKGPAASWGSMIVFCVLIMVGLALIVFPQWRDNERLPFPLLTVQQALIETPEEGGCFPLIFRKKLFWAGVITVFIIHLFRGLHLHTGASFPGFNLGWGLWEAFGQGMFRWLNWWVKSGRIIFVIVGITYFVPNRIAFSLWATVIGYQFYRMFGYEFLAPFHGGAAVADHRNGAVLGMALVILYLGRNQWLAVLKAMFRPTRTDADRRNRTAGLIFCIGCIGLLSWQLWAGNSLVFALLAVFVVVITSLVLARIVAETGIPVMGNSLVAGSLLELMPIGWLSAKAIYLTNSVNLVIGTTSSKVSAAVTTMHGFGLDRDNGPKRHARLAKGFVVLLLIGLCVAGIVHLWMGYNHPANLATEDPVGNIHQIEEAMHTPLKTFVRGSWGNAPYNRLGHTIFGLLLAVVLQIACLLSPLWPLHPAGLVIMDTPFIMFTWPSIFLGWAIKRSIVIYGGAKAYRLAKPLFLGLILGEIFAAVLWVAVPAILIWMGGDASDIEHLMI